MKFKTLTWNIGGGRLLEDGKDSGLVSSYTIDGIDEIANKIRRINPDIIALQEAHGNVRTNQIESIANHLGYDHFLYSPSSGSHIDMSLKLGNGLISRFPFTDQKSGLFKNPSIQFELEGRVVKSHDKGFIQCLIDISGFKLRATTLHLIPFRRMLLELDSETAKEVLDNVSNEVNTGEEFVIIQGDFNIDDNTIGKYLPELFNTGLSEIAVDQPTTPKGRRYDHVLYKGLELVDLNIDNTVMTDHYPVICTFQLPD